ncbi:hypothetical protein [Cytobacillus firmus]|uniref:hypothetical protein n=1 Tax=Cytobacillus firmus TaxID=1399 RepID=UPI001A7E65C9|nr:hypothetical protein [Cytobacillus firmus]MBG9587689.1 hypothetical protein [Cytobacillus firmus]
MPEEKYKILDLQKKTGIINIDFNRLLTWSKNGCDDPGGINAFFIEFVLFSKISTLSHIRK